MYKIVKIITASLLLGIVCPAAPQDLSSSNINAADLAKGFQSPPSSARMWTWWFWLNDHVDEQSITADLEALKAQGIAGVTIYSIKAGAAAGKGPDYMSSEWLKLFKHTVKEAERLGLGVSATLSSGWNAGGPWITPENGCKEQVSSEITLVGPQHFTGKLPKPAGNPKFYRDLAIQAFPAAASEANDPRRKAQLAIKSVTDSFGDAMHTPVKELGAAPLEPLLPAGADNRIPMAAVVDLSGKVGPDGTLNWEVPAGRWTILRSGYSMTGSKTNWSSPTGAGLEADPLGAVAMDVQFAHVAQPLIEAAGAFTGKVFRSVQIDSWERKLPNWSEKFRDDFIKYRGYDPIPYLPILAGRELGDTEITDRFLYDYRKTVADSVADHYFGRLSTLAESKGLVQQSEAGGVFHPKVMALDCLKNLGRCAIPMGEFWQDGSWVEADQNKNGKQTASAAHLYGKPIVAAEAFTSNYRWTDSPKSLKPTADRAFCEGFNHFFIFSSATHSGDGFPGTEFLAGTYFNRKITWWNHAHSFSDYVARCSHLLQQGLFAADVLFYNGDGAPNMVPPKHVDPSLGPGYDYDACNSEIILTRLGVKDGRIVLPDCMNYRLLVLPESATMPVEVLAKLKELVAAGMTLIGPKPQRAPGLTDYPRSDEQVKALADELWGNCDGTTVKEHAFGKGRVVWGKTIRDVLTASGVTPDFSVSGAKPDTFLDWIHRRVGDTEIYFVANRKDRAETAACTFRVRGKQPELWDPVTGTQRDAVAFSQGEGGTTVTLELPPFGSQFVVFRRAIAADAAGTAKSNYPRLAPMLDLTGPWNVTFDPAWGGPGSVEFLELADWTKRPEDGIRFYSGKATYVKTFTLTDAQVAGKGGLSLDLGDLNSLAEVRLNGKPLGILWTKPYRVALGDAAKAGANSLEVDIINLWPNRLIGDGPLAPEKRVTRTNIDRYNKAGPKPLPSGLLGPVSIISER